MNASATLRASYIQAYQLDSGAEQHLSRTPHPRPNFIPVDYVNYKARCSEEKSAMENLPSVFEEDPVIMQATMLQQAVRMFTVWPWRDANWIIAISYTLGGTLFTIGSVFSLLPLIAPGALNDDELGETITSVIGFLLFFAAGVIALPAVWNIDNGKVETLASAKKEASVNSYQPALLGSQEWKWLPQWHLFKGLLRTVPFQAALIQLLGGITFTFSTVAELPGAVGPNDTVAHQSLVLLPQAIGGLMFFLANATLLIWAQDRWYIPKPRSALWMGAWWNTIGGLMFLLSGIFLLLNNKLAAAIMTLVGSIGFMTGSLTLWYDQMSYHSRP
ncbi:hypothetical protein FOBRF1_012102 [Fusarium oxysporum]